MLDITNESLTELGMRLPFHAAQTSNGFYLARATWAMERAPEYVPHWTEDTLLGGERGSMLASGQVQATIFFRSAFQWKGDHRQMASCLMLYKSIPHEGWLYLGQTLDDVLAQLPEHGYTGTERRLPDP